MITRDRLEELLEKGAIIYTDEYRNSHFKIKLNKHFVAKLGNSVDLYGYGCDYFGVPLNHLFETKEEAEWHKEFGCIERTERLELPTWEEFETTKISVKFRNKKTKYSMYVFVKNKNTNNCRIIIYADDGEQDWLVFEKPLTKENYTLACRKCKELFLGKDS